MELTDAEFTAQDSVAPTITASGSLWQWGNDGSHHRGAPALQVSAGDVGTGVATSWAEINGIRVDFAPADCPGDRGSYASRFTPCAQAHTRSRSFDVSQPPFREGENQVRLCAADFADVVATANKTCTPIRQVLVDTQLPAPPVDLKVLEGADWQPANGFHFAWKTPPGQVAPILGALYTIEDPESGELVGNGYIPGNGIEAIGPLEVSGVGEHLVRIHLVDSALNFGSGAEVTVRFDDRPPGNVSPEPASGWVSKDELPLTQEIERAEAGGPSGITGYSLAVSDGGPTSPCQTDICLAPELTLNGGADVRTGSVDGLTEGTHWISAVAVSGASKSSLDPGSTSVRVDKTPPSTSIDGVPADWVNHPVTLQVQAIDALSGMEPRAGEGDGSPATFIDADRYATYESPGSSAIFTVATEGTSRVEYWAEDLAGNVNDGALGRGGEVHPAPDRALIKIDTIAPEGFFVNERDPAQPERVVLAANDAGSGVESASIEIGAVGSEASTKLPVVREGGNFVAVVRSDDMSPGTYWLRATVKDRAGNISVVGADESDQQMKLVLPLKSRSTIDAALQGHGSKVRSPYGAAIVVEGRLTADGGKVSGQDLVVTESFVDGASVSTRRTHLRTDERGHFTQRLLPGPSREIRVDFDGSPTLGRARSEALTVFAKGMTRLRIKRRKVYNGAAVKMTGRVGLKGVKRLVKGKLVAIQYLDPSRGKWRPVEVLHTRRSGNFRFKYRFRTITSAQRIKFRAVALPEAGWPYGPSTSKSRSVIVYPRRK